MGKDDKPLSVGKYNKIMDCWLNNKPYEDEDIPKKKDVPYDGCFHTWVTYKGLNQIDEYCTKCNKKQAVAQSVEPTGYPDTSDWF